MEYTPRSTWRVLFLAEQYGRMTLTLDEVAEQIGLAPGTIKNRRTKGEFTWLRSDGRTLYADVQDLADFLSQRSTPQPADAPTWMPPPAQIEAPVPRPVRRRRRPR